MFTKSVTHILSKARLKLEVLIVVLLVHLVQYWALGISAELIPYEPVSSRKNRPQHHPFQWDFPI